MEFKQPSVYAGFRKRIQTFKGIQRASARFPGARHSLIAPLIGIKRIKEQRGPLGGN
jgi:hypothetical protein